jgi:hypothetical protein
MFGELPQELLRLVFDSLLDELVEPHDRRYVHSPFLNTQLPPRQISRAPHHGQTVHARELLPDMADFTGDSSEAAGVNLLRHHVGNTPSQIRTNAANASRDVSRTTVMVDEDGIETLTTAAAPFADDDSVVGVRYMRRRLLSANSRLVAYSLVCREWRERFKPHLLRLLVRLEPDERAANIEGSTALRGATALDRLAANVSFAFEVTLGRVLPSDRREDGGPQCLQTFPIELLRHTEDTREKLVMRPSMVAYDANGAARVEAACTPSPADMARPPGSTRGVDLVIVRTTRIGAAGGAEIVLGAIAAPTTVQDLGPVAQRLMSNSVRTHCTGALVSAPRFWPIGVVYPPKTTSRALAKLCGVPLAPLRLKVAFEFPASGARAVAFSAPFYLTTRSLLPEQVAAAAVSRKEKRSRPKDGN